MKRLGGPRWPDYLTPNELKAVMDRLVACEYFLTFAQLCAVLRLSRPAVLHFMFTYQIDPVPMARADGFRRTHYHGEEKRVYRVGPYFNPADVWCELQTLLRRRGDYGMELADRGPHFKEPPDAPPVITPRRSATWKPGEKCGFNRWTEEEIRDRQAILARSLQWLQPKELANLLSVTGTTLYRWRRANRGPKYHQRPDLVPSSARFPDGRIAPRSKRTPRPSFVHRYDPVLYDRNQVLQWLENIYLQRFGPMV